MSNISIIIQREFNERVRKKSFIITTLLMPVLMIGLMAAPALIMQFSRGDEKVIAVIDDSGLVAPKLENDEEIRFETTELPTEEARKQLTDKFGVLYIGGDILKNPNNVRLYANSSSSLSLESNITGQIERILEAEKLKAYRPRSTCRPSATTSRRRRTRRHSRRPWPRAWVTSWDSSSTCSC